MSEFFVAGIDGGQSSTTAVVGDAAGRPIGRGTAGPADEVGESPDSTRLSDALEGALANARANAGLPASARFAAVVAGVSGYEGRLYGKRPELATQRLQLMHDAPIAHAGALAGKAGVVIVAGTGSVVYASGREAERTSGGWGYLFGDEGSAFWVVRETLAAWMRAADDGALGAGESDAACAFFERSSLRAIARGFYAGELPRHRLAAFAATALQFDSARAIAMRGAERLAALVSTAVRAGSPPTIALAGGMFDDAAFRRHTAEAIDAAIPGARVVAPVYEPSVGALLLAYREAGRTFAGNGVEGPK